MSEKQIEAYLNRKIKAMGGLCIKLSSPSHRGIPDRLVICNGKTLFVEVKSENGNLSSLQKVFIKKLELQGMTVKVAYGKEDIEKLLNEI